MFFAEVGTRLQLQLSNERVWSEPIVNRPHQLIGISYVTDPGFSAWDIVINEPGDVTIGATGVAVCEGCDDLDFKVTITARDD